MQYIPCNSALLAHETLFLTQKGTFLPKDLQKVRKSRQILIRNKTSATLLHATPQRKQHTQVIGIEDNNMLCNCRT